MKSYLVGRDPARLEEMRFLLANPTASLYNNRTQVVAAIEFACLDILGQAWGVPVCDILGGRVRDRVPFASYLFYRYAAADGTGTIRTADQLVAHARALKAKYGFTSHKLKGGVFPPDYELECYRAVAAAFPGDRIRFDPNAVWTTEQAVRFGRAIEDLNNDYLEDPVFGLTGMRHAREKLRIPLATNTVVVNFEQLAANVLNRAVDVILLDTTFWGGIRALREGGRRLRDVSARRRRALVGRARDSAGDDAAPGSGRPEPCLSPPTRTTTTSSTTSSRAASWPTRTARFACPTVRGSASGWIATSWPSTPSCTGSSGPYPYDQDPGRPGWAPLVPNDRWADPADGREPFASAS